MNDNRDTSDTDLPSFSVHVVPTGDIRAKHLEALLEKFRNGKTDPLVFGDDDEPEAVVIPFAAFLRLMRRDHADHVRAEDAFQAELSRRVEASDTARSRGEEPGVLLETDEDLFAWAESLGETGKDWADEQRARDQRSGHDR